MAAKRRKKRDNMRFTYNVPARKTTAVDPEPEPARDRISDETAGTIKAALIAKHGSRGYGRLVASLKGQAQ